MASTSLTSGPMWRGMNDSGLWSGSREASTEVCLLVAWAWAVIAENVLTRVTRLGAMPEATQELHTHGEGAVWRPTTLDRGATSRSWRERGNLSDAMAVYV
ncbi:hypothetical protein CKAH01_14165 [Colletotrichum kahawae]|uniref:Uncharacterized protein n=1 Tax=Colletotrichum kahawae TaxID=34407 RepID=A0AAE0DAP4_COLKA|nr:hypothetical protein CKAH01_14165 [Colletotrichum kahawae]